MTSLVVLPSQLDAAPDEPPQFIGGGVLVKGSLTSIVAESQAGKTFFLLHMACSMTMGRPFFGHPTWPCRVLVVVGEGFHGIPSRLRAWCEHHDVAPEELDRALAFLRVPLDISDDEMVARVLAELEALSFDVDVIIFDTLSSNAPRGFMENDGGHMKGYMDCARALRDRLNWTVVFIAHTGQANGAAANRAKGAYDFFASMDTELFIKNEGGIRSVKLSKSRDFPMREVGRFTLEPVGRSVVVVPVDASSPASAARPSVAPSAKNALATLIEYGMGAPITNQAWFYATKLQKTAFYAAKKVLLEGGYVLRDGKGFVPTNKADQLLQEVRELSAELRGEVRPRPSFKRGGANELPETVRGVRNELRADNRHEGPGLQEFPWFALEGAE